ncbi:hypothetical protein RJ640_023749, partial [Escallonia rubra]
MLAMARREDDTVKAVRRQKKRWIGITCSNGRRVTAVNLPDMGLTGTIPKEVGNLTSLVFLNISNNSLQGHLPAEVGLLHQLQYMSLQFNELSGEIPSSLSRCWKLRQLSLNGNKFNGSIPGAIGNLSKLEELYLGENDLQGRIPQEMSNLICLTVLSIPHNKLEGPIPVGILNISSLQKVELRNNSLSGDLPTDMCNSLHNLNWLSLPICRLRLSVVYRCFSAASFACKAIDKRLLTDPIDKLFHLLSGHPNIIQLFHLYEDDDAFLLVTDRRNQLVAPTTLPRTTPSVDDERRQDGLSQICRRGAKGGGCRRGARETD